MLEMRVICHASAGGSWQRYKEGGFERRDGGSKGGGGREEGGKGWWTEVGSGAGGGLVVGEMKELAQPECMNDDNG